MCCRAKDNTTALARSLQIMNALVCDTSASREGMVVLVMAAAAAWAKRALARTCRLDGKARRLARSAPVRVQGGLVVGSLAAQGPTTTLATSIRTSEFDDRYGFVLVLQPSKTWHEKVAVS